ncbi:MAG: DEAD/DEAH box helicase [Cytophagaceae bacterium]|jgi:ATP-dependent RNA helicase RhlE|nr:DEAD/DEAH box helicase [Cytophagaceae bacterium]
MDFSGFALNRQLLTAIEELGFAEPTEIQHKTIPVTLAGHDVLGIAQTGTGKTAAYLLPVLMKVKFAQGLMPRALVLVPTRELCVQVKEAALALAKHTDVRIAAVYGGVGIKAQSELIEAGTDLIIATPGRFMDLYLSGVLKTKALQTLVLDEADRMMDMGFMPQIRKILEIVPRKRQNLLFSATMPEKVTRLTEEFLEFPVRIEVTPPATPAKAVEQLAYKTPNIKTKINLLQYLIDREELARVIVFTRTRQHAENISKYLKRKTEDEVRVIHANKDQNARFNAMEAFREGNVRILVTTDVTARGIDISGVSHVINFDVPIQYDDYVHRIGRTGRAGLSGVAISFANHAEIWHLERIEKLIKMKIPFAELPAEVTIEETPFDERQAQAREIDAIKKRENPDFKGAFHEKKHPFKNKPKPRRKR